jgi:hypothetical protein
MGGRRPPLKRDAQGVDGGEPYSYHYRGKSYSKKNDLMVFFIMLLQNDGIDPLMNKNIRRMK